MCSGCGSKAWGEVRRVGVSIKPTLHKKMAMEFIILFLKDRQTFSTTMRSFHLNYAVQFFCAVEMSVGLMDIRLINFLNVCSVTVANILLNILLLLLEIEHEYFIYYIAIFLN